MMDAMIQKIPKGMMSKKAERYFGTIFEHVEGKLDLILERLDFSDKKSDKLENRMDSAEIRLDKVDLQLLDKE